MFSAAWECFPLKGNILKWMLNLFPCQRKVTGQPPKNASEMNHVLATLNEKVFCLLAFLLYDYTSKTLFLLGLRCRHYNFLTVISNLYSVAVLSCDTSATAGICLNSWQSISLHIREGKVYNLSPSDITLAAWGSFFFPFNSGGLARWCVASSIFSSNRSLAGVSIPLPHQTDAHTPLRPCHCWLFCVNTWI